MLDHFLINLPKARLSKDACLPTGAFRFAPAHTPVLGNAQRIIRSSHSGLFVDSERGIFRWSNDSCCSGYIRHPYPSGTSLKSYASPWRAMIGKQPQPQPTLFSCQPVSLFSALEALASVLSSPFLWRKAVCALRHCLIRMYKC